MTMPAEKKRTVTVSARITEAAEQALLRVMEEDGINKSTVIEMAIRAYARSRGLFSPAPPTEEEK